jgi:ribonuclease HI
MTYLSILCWNAASLVTNGTEFIHTLHTFKQLPHIICIQETNLNNNKHFNIKYYTSLSKNRTNSIPARGGVATYIRNDIHFTYINTDQQLEIIKIQITHNNQLIDIINVYNPPSTKIDYNKYCQLITNSNTILCGDFNARLSALLANINNTNGNIIEQIIDKCDLHILNDSTPTRYGIGCNPSVIDLALVTNSMVSHSLCQVLPYDCGSDHRIVHITVGKVTSNQQNTQRITTGTKMPRRYNVKLADWPKFNNICQRLCARTDKANAEETAADQLSRLTLVINSASEAAIPARSKKHSRCTGAPWWTTECEAAVRRRKAAKMTCMLRPSQATIHAYQAAKTDAKRIIKNTREKSWQEHCSSFNSHTATSKIWTTVRAFNRHSYPSRTLQLNINNNLTDNPEIVEEELKRAFYSVDMLTPPADDDLVEAATYVTADTKYIQHINCHFTMPELQSALSAAKETTPGHDNINYTTLRHLPTSLHKQLLDCANNIWHTGIIPAPLKHSIITPLLKPGKDPLESSSYRPIALTSCVGKIIERMVSNRLKYHMESSSILPNEQCGFRQGRCTTDNLTRLADDIHKATRHHKKVIAVFIDLNKAFDRLHPVTLLNKLQHRGITGNVYRYICNFLTQRTAAIKINNRVGRSFNIFQGSPQGSTISPLLFALLLCDFPRPPSADVMLSLYADDIAIWCANRSLEHAREALQTYLDTIVQYCQDNQLVISPDKTVAVTFGCRFLATYIPPRLYIDNNLIEVKDKARFLGLVFDRHLNFVDHVEHVVSRCTGATNVLRYLTGTTFGCNKRSLLKVYKATVLSVINYGCEAYHTLCKTAATRLDAVQTKALRVVLGALQATNNNVTKAETNQLPLHLERLYRLLAYCCKVNVKRQHVARNILTDTLAGSKYHMYTPDSTASKVHAFFEVHNIVPPAFNNTGLPPWLMSYPATDTSIADSTRKHQDSDAARKALCDVIIDSTRHTHTHMYSDASKSENGRVGAGLYNTITDDTQSFRLSDNVSIYKAELTAVQLAVSSLWLGAPPNKPAIIFTDSLSAVTSIKQRKSTSAPALLNNILTAVHELQTEKNVLLTIGYSPGHVNIAGNERADRAANTARTRKQVDLPAVLELADYKRMARDWVQDKYDKLYQQTAVSAAYKALRPTLATTIPRLPQQRKLQVIGTRLRVGRTLLAAELYLRNMHPDGLCQCTTEQQTIEHMIYNNNCRTYNIQRQKLHALISDNNGQLLTLPQILNDQLKLKHLINFFVSTVGRV